MSEFTLNNGQAENDEDFKAEAEVLVCVPDMRSPGGIASYYRSLEPHLSSRVRYFRRSPTEGRHGASACWEMAGRYFAFWQEMQRGGVKLVQINSSLSTGGMRRDPLFLRMAHRARKATVWFLRGWDEGIARKVDENANHRVRRLLRSVTAVIVLGRAFAERIRSWGFEGPIFIEATAVDPDLLKMRNGSNGLKEDKVFRILFLARLERSKGVFQLIDAFRLLVERTGLELELLIAGDGGARTEAEAYVRETGAEGVRFLGYVSGEQKAEVYRLADLYLFPSMHGEGMPNSVLEAMAFGLPVITTAAGGLSDFFVDGKMGYKVAHATPEAFASRIQDLMEQPGLRGEMSHYNADLAKRNFFAPRVVGRLEEIWTDILAGRAQPRHVYSWRLQEAA